MPWRAAYCGTAALLLLVPAIAGAPWSPSDFVFAALALGVIGLAIELSVRSSRSRFYRAGVGAALAAALLVVLAAGTVGMIGDETERYNLLFYAVLPVALAGAALAGFRAGGMALAMSAAALTQIAIAAFGIPLDLKGGIYSMLLAGPWLLSAALFRKAAQERGPGGSAAG